MVKKKQKSRNDDKATLFDQLDQDVLNKLKAKKQELKVEAQRQEAADEERKREERRQREKNKSFEELLSESNLDWKNFK